MSKLTSVVVFLVGVSCALLSSLILERFSDGPIIGAKTGSFLPLEDELYLHTNDISPNFLNPGTELAPKDTNSDQKTKNAEHEARNTLQAAAQMCQLGKLEKAGKLFEHALALSPRHPDVLTEYGEFLERSDVTRANHLYTRALLFAPGHRRALQNRQRTQPLVEQSDLELLRRIDRKLLELAQVPDSSSALRRVKKEAYFQQIHHTVGIEGNTMTLAETRMVVETRMAVGGRSVIEHNEILGLDAAIKYINTTLVHRIGDITLDDLLQIHRRVMGHADPLAAGQLRTTQVYVSEHVPPPPTRITPLLEGFIQWLNAPETVALHPVKYAALAHYKLVFIHPFSDGNGRTSRLLMNLILMQAGFPPVIIRKQDRHLYYRCLQLANEGDVRPFVRFIAECAEKTLDVYVWATSEYVHKIAASEAERQAATRRADAEDAFVRNFSGDDLVGFGTPVAHREPSDTTGYFSEEEADRTIHAPEDQSEHVISAEEVDRLVRVPSEHGAKDIAEAGSRTSQALDGRITGVNVEGTERIGDCLESQTDDAVDADGERGSRHVLDGQRNRFIGAEEVERSNQVRKNEMDRDIDVEDVDR